ncbi:MAG: sugar nucleotidyltransferase [Saprospiraceae bacterium]
MKAIIPVAGAGKRLRPFTYTQPKPLIPVAGKPILSYIVDQLADLGVDEFVFVIGYLGEKIREYVEETYPTLKTTFVVQEERRGSGHAIWLCNQAMGNAEEVVVVFGDTMIEGGVEKIVNCSHTCMAIKPVEDPRRFGVVELNKEGTIKSMVEKPRMPRSNQALVGFYKISDWSLLHSTLGNLLNDPNQEESITLTDGLMHMLDGGHVMHAEQVHRWYDCGDPTVLLETNRILLSKRKYGESQAPAFDGTIIIHPVAIGKNCQISDAIIGPNVSIGDNTVIERSMISDSIVGRYTNLSKVNLKDSVIGNDTALTGRPQSLNIGDNTELELG